jgi:hypothetical protein
MRVRVSILSVLIPASWIVAGCSGRSNAPLTPAAPAAIVTDRYARFVFPRESIQTYTWDVPRSGAYSGEAEFIWQVTWLPPIELRGKAPDDLSLITRWRPGGTRTGPLSALVASSRLEKATMCLSCDLGSVVEPDSALVAEVTAGGVVFTVNGAAAVKRIFPVLPDSVTLSRKHGSVADSRMVPLIRAIPR